MKKDFALIIVFLALLNTGFSQEKKSFPIIANMDHQNTRMRYKVVSSNVLDKQKLTAAYVGEISKFGNEKYESLAPMILEKSIPEIQSYVADKKLTYRDLTLFYLYRIHKYELNPDLSLNAVISLNPDVLKDAEARDKGKKKGLLYGMPILLKDNIGYDKLPTTAGAEVLKDNRTKDAFIVQRLKSEGAIILGKANLSEWAYYFCNGCPLGYSAVGGQTMNAYGRMIHESGGSSSGSGASIAANLAVAAVGSETSGSILSPSSLNSLVGLKPTVGLLSRSGIVPISSTLDTPGPMTKNVVDNAILLEAMLGFDAKDSKSVKNSPAKDYVKDLEKYDLRGKRFGAFKNLLEQANYAKMVAILKENGATVVELENTNPKMDGFRSILSLDMKKDLPEYLKAYASSNISAKSVKDVMDYNLEDEFKRAPYGQELFEGIYKDTLSDANFEILKKTVHENAVSFFDGYFKENKLDFVLSINNTHAGVAAAAFYPCLTLPMGYLEQDQPQGLTLIAPSWSEKSLLQAACAVEKLTKARKIPKNYK